MMSSATDSLLNNPHVTRLTTQIARLQERNFFSKERLSSLKTHFLITIGFLVLLYCLIYIQLLFFWLLKLIFRSIFRVISIIFWLPLRTVRFLIPKSIDYDILFPLFWLCSISSFYITKYSHENVWQFYDQQLVRRYKVLNYDQNKRDDVKRYVFIGTFVLLLLVQSLFILVPIALSVRQQHQQSNTIVSTTTPMTTTAAPPEKITKRPTAKDAVKDVVDTMGGNLYDRFINAFKDEEELREGSKRPPLVSDKKLEDTFKTIQKTIKKKIGDLNPAEEKKTSRFQRWIVHYLKAPFRKWEKKTNEQQNVNMDETNLAKEEEEEEEPDAEEENTAVDSSSDTEDDEDDDDDDDDDEEEEESDLLRKVNQGLDKVRNVGENIKDKISPQDEDSDDDDDEDSDDDDDDDDDSEDTDDEDQEEESTVVDKANQGLEKARNLGENIKNKVSPQDEDEDDDDEDDDSEDTDDEDQEEESTIVGKVNQGLDKVQNLGENIKSKISSQDEDEDDEDTDDDEDDDDSEDTDDDDSEDTDDEDQEEESTVVDKANQGLEKVRNLGENIKNKISPQDENSDDDEDEEDDDDEEQSSTTKPSSSAVSDDEDSDDDEDDDEDEEEDQSVADQIKEGLAKPIEKARDITDNVVQNFKNQLSSSDDEDEDEEETDDDADEDEDEESLTDKAKEQLTKSMEKAQNLAENVGQKLKSQFSSSDDRDEEETDDEDSDEDSDEESLTDKVKEQLAKPVEKAQNLAENVRQQFKDQLSSANDQEEEDDDDSDEDDDEESLTDKVKEQLTKPIESIQTIGGNIRKQLSASDSEDEESDDEDDSDDDEEKESITDRVKEKLAKPIEKVGDQLKSRFTSSDDRDEDDEDESGYESDEDDEQQSAKLVQKIKETFAEPIEKVKNVASNFQNKITPTTDDDDEEEEEDDEETKSITEKIKERLFKPVASAKDLGERALNSVKDKLSSGDTDEDDSGTESDEEEEGSLLSRVKENVVKPIATASANLRDKLPTKEEVEEEIVGEESFLDKTKHAAEDLIAPIRDKISSGADEIQHKALDIVHSAEDLASNLLQKSSKYLNEKTKQIKKKLPKTDKLTGKLRKTFVDPIESRVTKTKKLLQKKTDNLKKGVNSKIKSFKKNKKVKYLSEKVQSLSDSIQEKLPERFRKKKKPDRKTLILNKIKSSLQIGAQLNGWIDEGWNIWHLAKERLSHVFTSSSKHARHLPRYNTTSIYTAYTDLKCYDYSKKLNRYRALKRPYHYFLDTYRPHTPFPVYLSVLQSNGPRCYRQYPDSSCGVLAKASNRNFQTQLYRFVRFWAIIGILVIILSVIYKNFTAQRRVNPSTYRRPGDSDRSSAKQQQTTDPSRSTTTTTTAAATTATATTTVQRSSTINQQTISSNQKKPASSSIGSPLDEELQKNLQAWLAGEQNDGYRNLSETCRIAINNTFLKQLERLSVETLQFANAKIQNVSQTNNNNRSAESPAERIVINAVLDIDHLILNIVNTFKEQHFSLETQKLSGQLVVVLTIQSNQYSIEANLQKLQINPVNIIDPSSALSPNEKQSIVKLLKEIIDQTIVRCSFRLSDIQETTHAEQLHNSSHDQSKSLSTTSIQSNTSRSTRQATTSKYPQSESLPTVLINDSNVYTENYTTENEPKRLLIRIVKAVKLHDVEQPYCILELNHPKQVHQTSLAKNGLNPFWDERFIFECDDQSNQIHLQLIDRKQNHAKKAAVAYVDTVYADVSIPFSYITSTVYKQDVQISPQYPESILRIEFSTLSEEEALAANNGYDVESLTDSQTWTYNDREASKIEQEYAQRYQQPITTNDFPPTSYNSNTLPKQYGLSTSFYEDERDYSSTLPRSPGQQSHSSAYSPSGPLKPQDGGGLSGDDKPHKSKSFMSSLKHLTLPRRKHRSKDKRDQSMSSQASSTSQLNTSFQLPSNPVSHSLSSALPGSNPQDNFLSTTNNSAPIRRSRSISRSFKNLFRSSSKKKNNAAKTDPLGAFETVDHRSYAPSSAPTSKKLSFLQRRKSKQKAKEQTNFSTNSLSSYDCSSNSSLESVRDTPVRANVGHPVTMTKSLVR